MALHCILTDIIDCLPAYVRPRGPGPAGALRVVLHTYVSCVSCVCCVDECLVGVYILSLSLCFLLSSMGTCMYVCLPVTSLSSLPSSLPAALRTHPILPLSGAPTTDFGNHTHSIPPVRVCVRIMDVVWVLCSGWGGTSALTVGLMKGKEHRESTLRD